jgi:hypothetical protein
MRWTACLVVSTVVTVMAAPGATTVCKWKDNKTCAFSLGGDDGLASQLDFAIPEMNKRGLSGATWWINCGKNDSSGTWGSCWPGRINDWKAMAAKGHDFGNHTMHHRDVADSAGAEYEIGEEARQIWAANPPGRSKLQLFISGGGNKWTVSAPALAAIRAKYFCMSGRGGRAVTNHNGIGASASDFTSFVDQAIREGNWHGLYVHGVGPRAEWLPMDGTAWTAGLDYLVTKLSQVWQGSYTRVYKYDAERSTASVVAREATSDRIRLDLTSGKDTAVDDAGNMLFDEPLTLRTEVPADWAACQVTQAGVAHTYAVSGSVVQFDALPGKGEVMLTKGHLSAVVGGDTHRAPAVGDAPAK